jgi:UDPglucose--hexose-1-phosphate uridylyltransferase
MPLEAVNTIIETYHHRYVDLMSEHDNMMAILFRNHGPRAGTSLLHPHSQLVVASVVPRYVRVREEEAQRYFDDTGRCVFCDILDYERKEQLRVLLENDSFLAFVPFAAEVPFETWVVPKQHRADFGNIIGAEKNHLAHVLQTILSRLHEKLHDPDYNYVIHTAARYKAGEPHLHWYLQVRPRLTTRAGFEIGSGMSINPTLPEDNAAYLADAQQ